MIDVLLAQARRWLAEHGDDVRREIKELLRDAIREVVEELTEPRKKGPRQ